MIMTMPFFRSEKRSVFQTDILTSIGRSSGFAHGTNKFVNQRLVLLAVDITLDHRGRNAAGAHPKSASVNDYRRATGLEALFGYLHLKGDTARLDELFALFVSYLETNSEE
jgi:23S rRNA maturation mini-RNase III